MVFWVVSDGFRGVIEERTNGEGDALHMVGARETARGKHVVQEFEVDLSLKWAFSWFNILSRGPVTCGNPTWQNLLSCTPTRYVWAAPALSALPALLIYVVSQYLTIFPLDLRLPM